MTLISEKLHKMYCHVEAQVHCEKKASIILSLWSLGMAGLNGGMPSSG